MLVENQNHELVSGTHDFAEENQEELQQTGSSSSQAAGEGEESSQVNIEEANSEVVRNAQYDEDWDKEVTKRIRKQRENQNYIQSNLSTILN